MSGENKRLGLSLLNAIFVWKENGEITILQTVY